VDSPLAPIAAHLACPACATRLALETDGARCPGCGERYPVDDGVALLARHSAAGYESEFQDLERAAAYNLQFRRQPLKLGTTRREIQLIRRHLRRVGRSRVILDLPCGGGRLSPALAGATDLVIEADIGIGQIRYGRAHSNVPVPRVWMTASALHIPLCDASVDGVVCVRLVHHFEADAERERLFRELLRVSRRFVIVTFFDQRSFKNLSRRWRHPFRHMPPKPTMNVEGVAALALANGARLVDAPRLSWIGSGHRYALLCKDADQPTGRQPSNSSNCANPAT
jgi:SAM-dependent methyltransferase